MQSYISYIIIPSFKELPYVIYFVLLNLRLKWDKVLLVLIVHFARYDVSDIHYCGKTRREGLETFSRPAEHCMAVTEIQITAWKARNRG